MSIQNDLISVAIKAVMEKANELRNASTSVAESSEIFEAAYKLQADLRKMEVDEPFDLFDPKWVTVGQ